MLTSGLHEIEDIVDGELPSFSFFGLPASAEADYSLLTFVFLAFHPSRLLPRHSIAANRAIEAYCEERRAEGVYIGADAPQTLSE